MKNGVGWYTVGRMLTEIYFPEGDVRCCKCRLCRGASIKHKSCSITNQEVTDVYHEGIGSDCPLEFEKGECDNGNQNASRK